MAEGQADTDGFSYYHYDPSLVANAVFAGLFAVVSIAHAYIIVRQRAWYFIPFLVGCIFEVGGYVGRIAAANQNPDFTLGVYVWQTLLILLGPALMAASIYMVLGRMVRLLDAHKYALIRTTWMTKVFVMGDVLSFIAQGAGGGMMASDDESQSTQDLAQGIVLAGLGIQLLFFGLFILTTIVFHMRIAKNPTARSFSVSGPWQAQLMVLYASSVLIMIRSIFRLIEFAFGYDGVLMKHEAYLLGLDGGLMFIVASIFAWWHPYKALAGYKEMPKKPSKKSDIEGIEMLPPDSDSQSTIPKPAGPYDSDSSAVMVPLPRPTSSHNLGTRYTFGR